MTLTKDLEFLRNIPLFAKVEPAKLKLLAFTGDRLEYLSGDELFHEGDYGDAVYIILDGKVDILVDSSKGAVKVETLGKNMIGEIAILCGVPRTATAVARGDVVTLCVSKDGFFHLVTQFPQVGLEVMSGLATKLHRTTRLLAATRAKLNELHKG